MYWMNIGYVVLTVVLELPEIGSQNGIAMVN